MLDDAVEGHFSAEKHLILTVDDFLMEPESAIQMASLQKFAKITPQYPGVRATVPDAICSGWIDRLSPMLSEHFGNPGQRYEMQAWYSIVTERPGKLLPIQRLPHVDGTDPNQLAMMLYLHSTNHGGTAFYRHKSTGFEALTDESFPRYKAALERDVAAGGMPRAAYPSDGEPYFERTYKTSGKFNQAVFYRGNILHSGVIDNELPLPADPAAGRLTINAFFRPARQ